MTSFPWFALLGGALIGASASLLLLLNGKIAGVSGIVGTLITPKPASERIWRAAFVVGLIAGGLLLLAVRPEVFDASPRPWPWLALSGVLVGVGTTLGGGCTSGHGVCGLARGSKRSLVATLLFMGVAMLVALITHVVRAT